MLFVDGFQSWPEDVKITCTSIPPDVEVTGLTQKQRRETWPALCFGTINTLALEQGPLHLHDGYHARPRERRRLLRLCQQQRPVLD